MLSKGLALNPMLHLVYKKPKIFGATGEVFWYTGILPFAIEVRRFKNILEENRLCKLCNLGENEKESHFPLYCTNYDHLRELIFHEMARQNPEMF